MDFQEKERHKPSEKGLSLVQSRVFYELKSIVTVDLWNKIS